MCVCVGVILYRGDDMPSFEMRRRAQKMSERERNEINFCARSLDVSLTPTPITVWPPCMKTKGKGCSLVPDLKNQCTHSYKHILTRCTEAWFEMRKESEDEDGRRGGCVLPLGQVCVEFVGVLSEFRLSNFALRVQSEGSKQTEIACL